MRHYFIESEAQKTLDHPTWQGPAYDLGFHAPLPQEQHLHDCTEVCLDVHAESPPERTAGWLQHPAENTSTPIPAA